MKYLCTNCFSGLLSHQVTSAEHPSGQGTDAIWQYEVKTRGCLFNMALLRPPAAVMLWPYQAAAVWASCAKAGGEIRRGNVLLEGNIRMLRLLCNLKHSSALLNN